jgi:glycosyltransferase involved in cell wall biosynthesis
MSIHIQGPPLKGKVESLNDMMTLVKTDWVCLLDCDDVWLPTKLEEQINCLKALDYKVDVIGTFCQYFGKRSDSPSIPIGHIDPSSLETTNPIINSSSLIHRSYCYWRYTSICHGIMEDYDLWMRIAIFGGKLYNIPKVLCYHRIHPESAFNSKQQSPEALQNEYRNKNMSYFTL